MEFIPPERQVRFLVLGEEPVCSVPSSVDLLIGQHVRDQPAAREMVAENGVAVSDGSHDPDFVSVHVLGNCRTGVYRAMRVGQLLGVKDCAFLGIEPVAALLVCTLPPIPVLAAAQTAAQRAAEALPRPSSDVLGIKHGVPFGVGFRPQGGRRNLELRVPGGFCIEELERICQFGRIVDSIDLRTQVRNMKTPVTVNCRAVLSKTSHTPGQGTSTLDCRSRETLHGKDDSRQTQSHSPQRSHFPPPPTTHQ